MALRSQSNKRRRRRRSRNARAAAQTVRRGAHTFRPTAGEMLASVVVLVAALTLIALVWINEERTVERQSNEMRAQIEATVSGQALVLADEVRREILTVTQSLNVLKHAFQADPEHFDLPSWRPQLTALSDVADDVFIADNNLIIQHDINQASIGLGVGASISGLLGSAPTRAARDNEITLGSTLTRVQDRQHLSFLLMRLDHPGGWVIGATFRTDALTRLYAEASLGLQGMTALINTRLGRVQAIAGPGAGATNYDISRSPMYTALQDRPAGNWIGASAPDGVARIHGFRQVPGRDLAVVVAVDEAAAMRPVEAWNGWGRSVAWWATVVIIAAAGLGLYSVWTLRARSRLRQALDRERSVVTSTQLEATEMRTRLDSRTAQVRVMFANTRDGALLMDAELRVSEWNQPLPELLGIAPETLQTGLPLDDLFRSMARDGAFGGFDDLEAEVARRIAQLRTVESGIRYASQDGRQLAVTSGRLPDGGLLMIVQQEGQVSAETLVPILESSPAEDV